MICPYFSREEATAISCWTRENGGMRLRLSFPTVAAKQHWAAGHCECYEYWRCPMCEMIDEEERLREE